MCGKTPEVAGLQDVLIHLTKGISQYAHRARQVRSPHPYATDHTLTRLCVLQLGAPEDTEVNRFAVHGFFTTLTNVNFDASRFSKEFIPKALALRAKAKVRVALIMHTAHSPNSPHA